MENITDEQKQQLLDLGKKSKEVEKLTSNDAQKLIDQLLANKDKALDKDENYTLKGIYAHLTKGKIVSPHLLRGSIDVSLLLARPKFYLRNEAKRLLKDRQRNQGKERNVYPLLKAFGISEDSEIQKLAK